MAFPAKSVPMLSWGKFEADCTPLLKEKPLTPLNWLVLILPPPSNLTNDCPPDEPCVAVTTISADNGKVRERVRKPEKNKNKQLFIITHKAVVNSIASLSLIGTGIGSSKRLLI